MIITEITDPVQRARVVVGAMEPYELSAGDYHPIYDFRGDLVEDSPWTSAADGRPVVGCDCSGFAIAYCHRLPRHRPGFNRTPTATVSDELNTDSAVEDALTQQTLFIPIIAPSLGIAQMPKPGDLLVYKAIRLPGHPYPWIGHVCLVVAVDPAFDPAHPDWRLVTVIQCFGGNGRKPAVEQTDGTFWRNHDQVWGTDPQLGVMLERLSVVIRRKP